VGFIFIESFLLIVIIFLLLVLSMLWPPDSPWAPWWRTGDREIRESLKLAKVTKKDTIYELGSGDGRFLVIAAKEFGANGVGIEIDPLRSFISTVMIRINGVQDKITIKKKNFFDVDISKATVIFVYLVPKALGRLLPKFKKELKKGTRIVSYRYKINLPLKRFDKENAIRLYVL
jgi:16S rRNA A1518/A1519 N6-dimethyltransferase RsmA/KsgA/DIM1 with predicted DNA glycosylase/AP lyase activity